MRFMRNRSRDISWWRFTSIMSCWNASISKQWEKKKIVNVMYLFNVTHSILMPTKQTPSSDLHGHWVMSEKYVSPTCEFRSQPVRSFHRQIKLQVGQSGYFLELFQVYFPFLLCQLPPFYILGSACMLCKNCVRVCAMYIRLWIMYNKWLCIHTFQHLSIVIHGLVSLTCKWKISSFFKKRRIIVALKLRTYEIYSNRFRCPARGRARCFWLQSPLWASVLETVNVK